jgi:hypothetical protein
MKAKFGISYNIFDGYELLEDSITYIREYIDYISVVYQIKSNWGNDAHPQQLEILNSLLERKLIDELYLYKPVIDLENPKSNETEKRNIGLQLSKNNGCTHHMTMDCDEFYIGTELEKLKNICECNPIATTYGYYIDYIKSPTIRIGDSLSMTMISLFVPILDNLKYEFNYKINLLVDPTRILNTQNYIIIPSQIITMHHMTMVRKNIETKIINSGKRRHMTDEEIDIEIKKYNELDITSLDSIKSYIPKLIVVEPVFELKNYNNF